MWTSYIYLYMYVHIIFKMYMITIFKIAPYLLISHYLESTLYVKLNKEVSVTVKSKESFMERLIMLKNVIFFNIGSIWMVFQTVMIFSFYKGSKRCSQLRSLLSTNEWEGREISGWGAAAERVPLTGTHRIPGGNATAFIILGSSRFLTKKQKKMDWKKGWGGYSGWPRDECVSSFTLVG